MTKRDDWLVTLLGMVCGLTMVFIPPLWAEAPQEEETSAYYFTRIAVAPVLVGHRRPNMDEKLDDTLSCPIDQICMEDQAIQPDAGQMLMRLIQSVLKQRFGQHVVPMDQVQSAYTRIRLDGSKDSPRTLARRLSEQLDADLMVIGKVWRYRDRGAVEGFPDKPASVAFALYLVEPVSGRQLWRGLFDEAQEFALQNMGKFTDRIKMGLKWLSANELARHGVKEVFKPFPDTIKPATRQPSEQGVVK